METTDPIMLEPSLKQAGSRFMRELLAHFEQDTPDRGIPTDSTAAETCWEEL